MVHTMRLNPKFFSKIENNNKRIEVRLADEKRKRCRVGDSIIFVELSQYKKSISVVIDSINYYSSFRSLISTNNIQLFGIEESEVDVFIEELQNIYPNESVIRYGLVGIRFHIKTDELQLANKRID